jgi:hypothetical protein
MLKCDNVQRQCILVFASGVAMVRTGEPVLDGDRRVWRGLNVPWLFACSGGGVR